jgi:cysteine-rich repeat protein
MFDDTSFSPYTKEIDSLFQRGIVQGYADESYKPQNTINRAEFLKMLIDALFPSYTPGNLRCFDDLDVPQPAWYARTTCAAKELGIVEGYPNGQFRPARTVQLDEALKMSFVAFGLRPAIGTGDLWYTPYIREAKKRSILPSLLDAPAHLLTREEMARIVYVLIQERESGSTSSLTATPPICGNGVTEAPEQCDDGNVQDSDGCSSICVIVPEPIRRSVLQIDQQTTGTLSTTAQGQQNIALLKFTAVAGRQDALITSLIFEPSVGSLLYAQHYELAMDRDGNGTYETVAQSEGKVQAGKLIFDELHGGVLIPDGLIVPFVVRADLSASFGPVSFGLKFSTGLPDYVEAQGAEDNLALEGIETNSVCTANCFIRVNTIGSTNITVQDRGNLYVTEDSTPAISHILLGSTTSDAMLRLRLRATDEAIDLKTIRIDGVPSSIDSLLLYRLSPGQSFNPNSATPFAQASHGQCPEQVSTRFCASLPLNTFVIQTSEEAVLVIAGRVKSDQLGGTSGQTAALSISSSTLPSTAAFQARGVSSTQELTQNDANVSATGEIFVGTASNGPNVQITGRTNDTAFASIGAVTNDGLTNGGSIPSGFMPFGWFKIAALPHSNSQQGSNTVNLQSIVFHVSAQNVQIDPASFKLSTRSDPSAQVSCSAGASTGSFDVTCSSLTSGNIQYRIDQGMSVSYVLSANITNTQISPGHSSLSTAVQTLGQRGTTNSIQWSDEITTFSWVDVPVTSVQGTTYGN